MKKMIISFAFFIIATNAFSATKTTLNCELQKAPGQIITFHMLDLGKPGMDLVHVDEDEYVVFTTKSKNPKIVRLVDTLNGQGGDLRVAKDRINFFGDSAGIDFADFTLFANTGYRSGFARINFNFGNEKDYSAVRCNLR